MPFWASEAEMEIHLSLKCWRRRPGLGWAGFRKGRRLLKENNYFSMFGVGCGGFDRTTNTTMGGGGDG